MRKLTLIFALLISTNIFAGSLGVMNHADCEKKQLDSRFQEQPQEFAEAKVEDQAEDTTKSQR